MHAHPDSVRPVNDLEGRVIAIAGAGGGLGPVVAKRLANGGASLALADRKQETSDSVAGDLGLPADRVRDLKPRGLILSGGSTASSTS